MSVLQRAVIDVRPATVTVSRAPPTPSHALTSFTTQEEGSWDNPQSTINCKTRGTSHALDVKKALKEYRPFYRKRNGLVVFPVAAAAAPPCGRQAACLVRRRAALAVSPRVRAARRRHDVCCGIPRNSPPRSEPPYRGQLALGLYCFMGGPVGGQRAWPWPCVCSVI